MLRYSSPCVIIDGIGVGLNFLDVGVRIERGLCDLEVLHELQRDSVWCGIEAVDSAVTNGELNSEDVSDALADDLQLASIDCQNYSNIAGPEPVAILTVSTAGKCAPRLLFVPTNGRWRGGSSFAFVISISAALWKGLRRQSVK